MDTRTIAFDDAAPVTQLLYIVPIRFKISLISACKGDRKAIFHQGPTVQRPKVNDQAFTWMNIKGARYIRCAQKRFCDGQGFLRHIASACGNVILFQENQGVLFFKYIATTGKEVCFHSGAQTQHQTSAQKARLKIQTGANHAVFIFSKKF